MKGVEAGDSGVYQLPLCKLMKGRVELVSKYHKKEQSTWVAHNQKKKLVCKKEILNMNF